ncbi:hypothetical protein ACEPAH_2169 [Sanghuangporus vaninii]
MFKFNFSNLDIEDDENQNRVMDEGTVGDAETTAESTASSCRGHDDGVHDLENGKFADGDGRKVQALPPAFSYSPLVVPLSSSKEATETSDPCISGPKEQGNGKKARNESDIILLRRDLFDARYQLISETDTDSNINAIETMSGPALTADTDNVLRLIDNPSDLVPGVYEGGLKTWECSLDLVDYLSGLNLEKVEGVGVGSVARVRGKRVIEIGCGTAMPSLYLLHVLFSHPQKISSESDAGTAWTELSDMLLRSQRRDLQITPELLTTFRSSLEEQHISIRFIAGSWQSLADNNDNVCTFPFDITLTSETIYQTSSLPSLIILLKRCASSMSGDDDGIATRTQELSIEETGSRKGGRGLLCLVAAKVLYFGVGGGVMEFERAVREAGGKTSTVLERKTGVGRRIMSVEWT